MRRMLRQWTSFRRLAALAVAGFAGACGTASAAPPPKHLWATVNICDTVAHPNQMGVRASMPGNPRHKRQRMFMRFHAQSYNATTKKWSDAKGVSVSGWLPVGSARARVRQGGYTFSFMAPNAGSTFVLRGVVDFQWRQKRRTKSGKRRLVVVRTLHANTKGEHPSAGADPPGYSSGTCEIR
jgi:hypothetical protein